MPPSSRQSRLKAALGGTIPHSRSLGVPTGVVHVTDPAYGHVLGAVAVAEDVDVRGPGAAQGEAPQLGVQAPGARHVAEERGLARGRVADPGCCKARGLGLQPVWQAVGRGQEVGHAQEALHGGLARAHVLHGRRHGGLVQAKE
eukprot:CAMPEP_0206024302 /NCGR_PEP_ID=MMETSP1464-20131121/37960_1 /ASSEMBLY_ACC=CAM_ASM_001124 /TAXON_ID=119497 /ORGANISM="Exanthemachrysis gayraliae, Strain RCC1523" /LENGTH=143 /DNA_ID=CAMNT_0053398305 /DNA_START=242 /DNA_END=669 /DNA_ORIENTATION=+